MIIIGNVSVKEFKGGNRRNPISGGYHVIASVKDCSDGMYQEIKHPAVFRTLERAQQFKNRISKDSTGFSWNLSNWIVGCHPCNAWQSKPEDEPLYYGVF